MNPVSADPTGTLMYFSFPDLLFYVFAALAFICGLIVVYSENIVHSGFALLGTFAGVAGLYAILESDFIAAAQFLVYVGGILIVILFAVMLTRGIKNVEISNPSVGLLPATILGVIIAVSLSTIAVKFPFRIKADPNTSSIVNSLGEVLLGKYLIPFEVLSLLLLAALIGSVMLVRKEIKNNSDTEVES